MTDPKCRLFPKRVAERYDDTAAVIRADARNLPLPDESVDLIVTSPPYFALRSYRDGGEHFEQIGGEPTPQEFIDALTACMVEWRRILKPSGSVWINLGDKYAGSGGHNNSNIGADGRDGPSSYNKAANAPAKSLMGLPWRFAIAQIDTGWILRAEVVWSKPNGLPESVTDRVRRSHEQWFHFVKEPRYFSAVDEIRESHTSPIHSPGQKNITNDRNDGDRNERTFGDASLGRVPGSVWTIPTEPLTIPDEARNRLDLPDHFAAFPQEWPRRIILGWSPSRICTECGEGRRPVTDVTPSIIRPSQRRAEAQEHGAGSGRTSPSGTMTQFPSRVITGEQCACSEPIAPTIPAVVLDPLGGTGTVAGVARTLGRYGISNDLSADYNRLAVWRIWESGHFERGHEKYLAEKQVGQPSDLEKYLMSFPGIGKVSARAIVETVGNPFTLTSDITQAKGVGVKARDKIMDELGMFTSWETTEGEDIRE